MRYYITHKHGQTYLSINSPSTTRLKKLLDQIKQTNHTKENIGRAQQIIDQILQRYRNSKDNDNKDC